MMLFFFMCVCFSFIRGKELRQSVFPFVSYVQRNLRKYYVENNFFFKYPLAFIPLKPFGIFSIICQYNKRAVCASASTRPRQTAQTSSSTKLDEFAHIFPRWQIDIWAYVKAMACKQGAAPVVIFLKRRLPPEAMFLFLASCNNWYMETFVLH